MTSCDWCGPGYQAEWEATRVDDGPLLTVRRAACDRHLAALDEWVQSVGGHYHFDRVCRPDPRRPRR